MASTVARCWRSISPAFPAAAIAGEEGEPREPRSCDLALHHTRAGLVTSAIGAKSKRRAIGLSLTRPQ